MTKERLESILTEYGVPFTDTLADRLLKEFTPLDGEYIKKIKEKCDSINEIAGYQLAYGEVREIQENLNEILEIVKAIVPKKGEWIPVSSVEEMPKECLWVTHKGADYAYVEMIGWDSQRECRTEDGGFRCDSDRLKDIVAYMPYSEPEPYKEGGNE